MAVQSAVRHWVERAEAVHGPTFEAWVPEAFDWQAFCADTPRFAAELGERFQEATAAAARARLEELAAAAFRGGYIATIALLAAYDAQRDPEDALARLVAPLDEAETEVFEGFVESDLGVAEELMAGAPPTSPSHDALAAARIATIARGAIREILGEGLRSGAKALVSLGAGGAASAKVLSGVVNVAIAVAAFRYASAGIVDTDRDALPLRYDPAQMSSALRAAAGA